MKVTGNEFLNMCSAFSRLITEKMNLNTACSIAKNIKEMDVIKKVIDEKRNTIIMEHAEKDSEGNIITNNDGSVKTIADIGVFSSKMADLLSQEIEIEIAKISKSNLENISISPMDILALEKCLEE